MTFHSAFTPLSYLILLISLGCVSSPNPANPGPEPQKNESALIQEAPPAPLAPLKPSFRLSDAVVPLSYHIHLQTDPTKMDFQGEVTIIIQLKEATQNFFLHSKNINIEKMRITAGSVALAATFKTFKDDEQIGVFLEEPQSPRMITVIFNYTAPYSTDLDGLYRVVIDHTPYLFTQMEPIAARTFIPCFDEPKFKTPFQMRAHPSKGAKSSHEYAFVKFGSKRWATTFNLSSKPAITNVPARPHCWPPRRSCRPKHSRNRHPSKTHCAHGLCYQR